MSSVHKRTKKEVLHGLGMLIYEDLLPTTIFDSKGKKEVKQNAEFQLIAYSFS